MKDYFLYEVMDMPYPNFPIKIHDMEFDSHGIICSCHWHEHMELLYFVKGKAIVECSQKPFEVSSGDLIIINCNELHQIESISGPLKYYCIIIDTSILFGQSKDLCQSKYISPIAQNLILFKNRVNGGAPISLCIQNIISEYYEKNSGFELEIKSSIYHLFAVMLRNYIDKVFTEKEYNLREKNMERFNEIFKYIEINYMERISINKCSKMLNITNSHFCHLFKQITDRPLSKYINHLRLKKAECLLISTCLNISDIAMAVGFNDITYFNRQFKKNRGISPTDYRRLS